MHKYLACYECNTLKTNVNPSLVLVQPRKTRPFITERLLMGRKESNQTNKTLKTRTPYTLANSEDADERPHNVAFHQGLHCLLGKK